MFPAHPASLLHKPIAIVGMACRLPGADNIEEYWELLRSGRSAIAELPPERLDRQLYYDPHKGVRGKTYSTLGGLVRDRPIDPAICPLTDEQQRSVDPCHLIMCEVACAACQQAGYDIHDLPFKKTGVYIGHSGGSTEGSDLVYGTLAAETAALLAESPSFQQLPLAQQQTLRDALVTQIREKTPQRNADGSPQLDANAAASLIAQVLKVTGPHLVTDAACASSVVALALGSLAVQSGQVDMALVGGASYSKAGSLILFSQAQSCSATGTRPFDDDADGLVSSEGYVAFVIKTLDRAVADGDTIQAVISGLGLSADGRGRSLWAPRQEGQAAAMERAYSEHVRAEEVQYIEAHATSTQIGDATEMEALTRFYQNKFAGQKVPVGSVKSNIGHTLETAGLASLLKTVLAIKHQVMPPTINFEKPNQEIPWDEIPFQVLTTAQPWPKPLQGKVRRAGVNAFGIGGLNVHAVIDEFSAAYHNVTQPLSAASTERQATTTPCPLAIIGRGVVLPGANSVAEFADLVATQKSQLCQPPAGRWRDRASVQPGPAKPWQAPTNQGGYIQGYEFDWRKHRIPPKQIANANPLQFMLLDAAHQAFDESGATNRELDRSRTAVVVGTLFGGEFGHQLVAGLRLEELKQTLAKVFQQHRLSTAESDKIVDEFVEHFLHHCPALIDETGSFTSSTLASRISKELNLMGGAMAIDAGDCSSFAALDVASKLLASGACSQILCAGAQRSMDLANYEALALQGRLQSSQHAHDGFLPGEGAAAVLLKRLDDAERDGDKILGVLHHVAGATHAAETAAAITDAAQQLANSLPAAPRKQLIAGCQVAALDQAEQTALSKTYGADSATTCPRSIGLIGHTMAAHGMVETIISTFADATAEQTLQIVSGHAPDGQAYQVALSCSETLARSPTFEEPPLGAPAGLPSSAKQVPDADCWTKPAVAPEPQSTPLGHVTRFQADSPAQLNQLLQQTLDSSDLSLPSNQLSNLTGSATHRLAIISSDADNFKQQLQLALSAWQQPTARVALAKKNIFFGTMRPLKTAFVFTGQGSQYPGMFAALPSISPAAKAVLEEANEHLQRIAGQSYEQLSGVQSQQLGSDIWATQASLLVADLMVAAWLEALGIRPDRICGHSFGEYAALSAAGSCSLEQIIRITRQRTLALEANIDQRGALVSLHAPASRIETLISTAAQPVSITHCNAPQQTVVGGTYQAVAQFSELAEAAGITGHLLSVPCAFHTPLMAQAQRQFQQALQQETLLPVTTPLLSSVTNRYLADPSDLRDNLVQQMVQPVCYLEMIERLASEGVNLFIEIGPQQVLTRLNSQILTGSEHLCLATDEPGQTPAQQTLRLQVQLECLLGKPLSLPTAGLRQQSFHNTLRVEHFDATTKRKQRMRTQSATGQKHLPVGKVTAPEKFDATQARRQRMGDSARATQPDSMPAPVISLAKTTLATDLSLSAVPAPPVRNEGLEQFLVDFIVEQTGYPPEIIELDWNLEADLGIDSIKKAQLLGELREIFDFESTLDPQVASQLTLDQFDTLRSILELLEQSGGKSEWLAPELAPAPLVSEGPAPLAITSQAAAEPTIPESTGLEAFLIDFVVEQTGYPPEIIELDAQFEADLGIDSIKKAQLFGELREHFQLQIDSSSRLSLSDFLTLRDVLGTLGQMIDEQSDNGGDSQLFSPVAEQNGHSPVTGSQAHSPVERLLPAPVAEPVAPRDSSSTNGSVAHHVTHHSQHSASYLAGLEYGKLHGQRLRLALYQSADRFPSAASASTATLASTAELQQQFSAQQWQHIEGIAVGADLDVANVSALQRGSSALDDLSELLASDPITTEPTQTAATDDSSITVRRLLTLQTLTPLRGAPEVPRLRGAALVLGQGPVADQFEKRIAQLGQHVYRIRETDQPAQVVQCFEQLWQQAPVHHLFLTTPREAAAQTTWDEAAWRKRRQQGIMTPFWLCQSWLQRVIEAGIADDASLVATLSLGGNFGFCGDVPAVESGGLAGLLKAILIENWTNDIRTLPVKLIDAPAAESAEAIVSAALRELAVPSYDCEVSCTGGKRQVVRALPTPLLETPANSIRRGGNWIFTGGARGITAHVALQLAQRYQLRVHLIGTMPLPQIQPEQKNLDAAGLKQLKIQIMMAARTAGENPIQAWESQEKSLEIDATLSKLAAAGISAKYYACDVADRAALAQVLDEIRATSGPIDAIIHGAGIGKDSRYDKKQPEKVDQCIRAKVESTAPWH